MSSYSRVGVVTGANKGIGFAIVRQLALQYPNSPLNNGPLLICSRSHEYDPPIDSCTNLAARDKGRGEAALQALQKDAQLKQAKALQADGGLSEIKFHTFELSDSASVKGLAEHLKEAHPDGIDFVINNAAIAMDGFDLSIVKQTLNCNYYSTLSACHAFLPLLRPTGRIVNVASGGGALSKYSPSIRARFLGAQTEDDITSVMSDFASAVEAGREKEAGFPSAAYAVSKAGLIGVTKVLAKQDQGNGGERLINSVCPGYVKTDMTKGNGTKTVDEGASTPVWLAIHDFGGKTGAFWREEKEIEW